MMSAFSGLSQSAFAQSAPPPTGSICGNGVNCPPDFNRPNQPPSQPNRPSPARPAPTRPGTVPGTQPGVEDPIVKIPELDGPFTPGVPPGHARPVDPYRPDPSPYDPPRHQPPYIRPGEPHRYVRQVELGRYFRAETLDLVYLTRMDRRYDQGARLESVEIFLQDNGRSSLALYADRNLVDSSNYLNRVTVLQPRQYLEFGRHFQNLQLSIGGKLWIDRIVVHLVQDGHQNPPPYPNPNPGPGDFVDFRINQDFYGHSQLDLMRMLELYQYRGYEIAELEVEAMSLDRNEPAVLELLINGYSEGSTSVDQYNRTASFLPRSGIIGGGADSIILNANGDVRIENIRIRFYSR